MKLFIKIYILAFLVKLSMNNITSDGAQSEEQNFQTTMTSGQEISSGESEENFYSTSAEILDTTDDKNATGTYISAEQIAPIISQLLSPISSTIKPFLGPLAPLSNILGNVITNTVTELVVNLLNDTVSSAKQQEIVRIQQLDYTTYLVSVPNNGRFLLFSKNSSVYSKSKKNYNNSTNDT